MKIKLLQFTDLHLKELPFDEKDVKTLSLIERLVIEEKPELIIFTGDIVWGTVIDSPLETFEAFITFCNSLDTQIGITYGNHDVVLGEQKRELYRELEASLLHPVKKKNVQIIDNRENFCIEIEGTDVPIVVMDSGGYQRSIISKYDYLLSEQINWFDCMIEKYTKAKDVLIFQHIPLIEYLEAYKNNRPANYTTNVRVDGPDLNTGFFSKLLEKKKKVTLSVGHNHENNFQTDYLGVDLMFGQLTGYSPITDIKRGARKFIISKEGIESTNIY